MSTRACTRAYATSRLYSTLVLYRKVSKPSRPAFIMITVPVESDRHNVSCGKHHDYKAVSARHACETATVCQVAHLLNNESTMLSNMTLYCEHRTNPTASTVHQVHLYDICRWGSGRNVGGTAANGPFVKWQQHWVSPHTLLQMLQAGRSAAAIPV